MPNVRPLHAGPCPLLACLLAGAAALAGAVTPLPAAPAAAPGDAPPAAVAVPVTDTYHGTEVVDPYRWMEDARDEKARAWLRAQADYTRTVLDGLPGRAALRDRILELANSASTRIYDVRETASGRVFYLQRKAGEETGSLYVREGWDGPERLLVDPATHREAGGPPHAINYHEPSDDGALVAYGESAGGSELATIRILDVETGRVRGAPVPRGRFGALAWLPGNRGLLYNQLRDLPPGTPPTETYQASQVRFRTVDDEDPADDPSVFGTQAPGGLPIEPPHLPFVSCPPGQPHLYGFVIDGVRREFRLLVADDAAARVGAGPVAWRQVFDFADEVTDFAVRGDDLFLLTFRGAPRFRLTRTSLARPDAAGAGDVVPPGTVVLQGVFNAADAVYVRVLDGGLARVLRLPDGRGPAVDVPLALSGSADAFLSDARRPGFVAFLSGWTDRGGYYRFDPATGVTTDTGLQPRGPYDRAEDLVATEVRVPSHDGVEIPLSIIHRRDLPRDGSAPALLYAYGAYGITDDPSFGPTRLAWFERGGVFAVAHVRGGGAFGKEWHEAGRRTTKPNTWKDFLACGAYLVREGYTSPEHLCGQGGSAGGITVGRALTERPGLFRAIHGAVGVFNTVRAETDPNGVPNIPEFGTVADEEGFRALLAMDSLHHVVDGTAYPAVLLSAGINDPRVPVWHAAKFAARLQQANPDGRPVLLSIDYEAGHGMGSTMTQYAEDTADAWAFFLWQTGHLDFQPPPRPTLDR